MPFLLIYGCVSCICSDSDHDDYTYTKSSTSSKYGAADYIKDTDPDLYDAIYDRYNNLQD